MKLLIFWAILKRKLNTINSAQQVRKADLVKGLEAKALAVAILADLADSATSLIHFFGGGGSSRNQNAPRQGRDLQYEMRLTFEEAIFGKTTEIQYSREETCSTCNGSGAKAGTSPVTCSHCGGRGFIQVQRQTPLGRVMTQQECDVCHGTGKEIKEKCTTCHGAGHVRKKHAVQVKVPAGVENGNQMRLQGQGEAGFNGGPYGDLFIVFVVDQSKEFRRDGAEIYFNQTSASFRRLWAMKSKSKPSTETSSSRFRQERKPARLSA